MKDIKLIACDLDGTLMNLSCRVDPRDRQALARADRAGVNVCVCTGRALHHIPDSVRSMNFIRYYVTSNGSRIFDTRENEVLALYAMPPEKVLEVVDIIAPLGATFNIHSDGYDLSDRESYELLKKLGAFEDFVSMGCAVHLADDIRALVRAEPHALQKMLIMFRSAPEYEAARRALEGTAGIQVTTSFANTLEITAAGVRKDRSLAQLCDRLGIGVAQTAAIGDSDNDVDMLRFAGVGVAVENASAAAKAAADYLSAPIGAGGVAQAVDYLLENR